MPLSKTRDAQRKRLERSLVQPKSNLNAEDDVQPNPNLSLSNLDVQPTASNVQPVQPDSWDDITADTPIPGTYNGVSSCDTCQLQGFSKAGQVICLTGCHPAANPECPGYLAMP
jgi:hypothetical protein